MRDFVAVSLTRSFDEAVDDALCECEEFGRLPLEQRHHPPHRWRYHVFRWWRVAFEETEHGDTERVGDRLNRCKFRHPLSAFNPGDRVDGDAGPLAQFLLRELLREAQFADATLNKCGKFAGCDGGHFPQIWRRAQN